MTPGDVVGYAEPMTLLGFLRGGMVEARASKKVRFPEGLMTWREWLARYATSVKSRPSTYDDFYDRRAYNRDSQAHEESIRRKMSEQPLIYITYGADATFHVVPKEAYEWAVANGVGSGKPAANKAALLVAKADWRVRDVSTGSTKYFLTERAALNFLEEGLPGFVGLTDDNWEDRVVLEKMTENGVYVAVAL